MLIYSTNDVAHYNHTSQHDGDIFGILPSLALNSADDLGDGRIIPSLSVDQYAASLASWFGLTTAELNTVFPNLNRFDATDLGIFG